MTKEIDAMMFIGLVSLAALVVVLAIGLSSQAAPSCWRPLSCWYDANGNVAVRARHL